MSDLILKFILRDPILDQTSFFFREFGSVSSIKRLAQDSEYRYEDTRRFDRHTPHTFDTSATPTWTSNTRIANMRLSVIVAFHSPSRRRDPPAHLPLTSQICRCRRANGPSPLDFYDRALRSWRRRRRADRPCRFRAFSSSSFNFFLSPRISRPLSYI